MGPDSGTDPDSGQKSRTDSDMRTVTGSFQNQNQQNYIITILTLGLQLSDPAVMHCADPDPVLELRNGSKKYPVHCL
jgi:hypothetical protein